MKDKIIFICDRPEGELRLTFDANCDIVEHIENFKMFLLASGFTPELVDKHLADTSVAVSGSKDYEIFSRFSGNSVDGDSYAY